MLSRIPRVFEHHVLGVVKSYPKEERFFRGFLLSTPTIVHDYQDGWEEIKK